MSNNTPEAAIACIDEILSIVPEHDERLDYELSSFDFDWLEVAKVALEKQIPKKPVVQENKCFEGSTDDFTFICPVCNRTICSQPEDSEIADFVKENYHHCICGQILDWGEANA